MAIEQFFFSRMPFRTKAIFLQVCRDLQQMNAKWISMLSYILQMCERKSHMNILLYYSSQLCVSIAEALLKCSYTVVYRIHSNQVSNSLS